MAARLGPFLVLLLAALPAAGAGPNLPPPALNLTAPGPFPAPPLTASPAALAAAVAALPVPEGAPAQMLFQESRFDFDAAGRISFHRHWIYRILRAEGLRDWGVSQVRYSPWHQQKPLPRVRVIGPDLEERRFEASAYADKPASEGREDLFGDRRVLELKLPVAVGSIVEEEITVADTAPYFPAGTTLRHYAALYIPVLRGRLVLEAPTRLPLRYGLRLLPGLEPRKTVANGRVRLDFDYAAMPAAGTVEVGIPGHRPRFPHVAFSTGRDWQAIAAAYHQELETALEGAALDDWPRPPEGLSPADKVAFLLAALGARVRTSSLELGAGPAAPRPPAEVAREGRGDGKDIAALMVALLRRSGIEGRLALLSSGFGPDCEAKLPGLGLFNHAVVLVPGAGPGGDALWLDPSAPFARAGELPLPAQGRFALVVDEASTELILTPATRPYDNRTEETREVFLADYGPGRVVETSRHYGSADRNQRQVTDGLEPSVRRRGYQAYVQVMHGAAGLGQVEETAPGDLQGPFTLKIEALDCQRARTELDRAVLEIPRRELLRRLPSVFQLDELPPRQEEFVFHEPFATFWHYVIHLPPGFAAGELPPPSELPLGPGKLSMAFREEGGTVYGELSLDVGQRLLSARQFEDLRQAVREVAQGEDPLLVFPHHGRQLAAAGDPAKALAELRAAVAAAPQQIGNRLRLARLFSELGFYREAQRQSRESARLAPASAEAQLALGRALEYDELGRRFSPYAELDAARAALAKAAELGRGDPDVAAELAAVDAVKERLARLAAPRPELHPDDPQTPVEKLLLAHLAGDGDAALALLHPRSRDLAGLAALDPLTRWIAPAEDPAGDPLADWETRLTPKPSGAPHLGYRLAVGAGHHVYLSRLAGGGLAIVGSSEQPALLGGEAFGRLQDGDAEALYRWLDWAREDLLAASDGNGGGNGRTGDPLGPRAWLELWKGEKDENEKTLPARARVAAAALAAPLDKNGRTLATLDGALANPGGEKDGPAIAAARAEAKAAAGNFAELREEATSLAAAHPDSAKAARLLFAAHRGLGDWDGLEKAARDRLAERPQDAEALRALADWAAHVGAPERALEPLRQLAQTGALRSEDGVSLILATLGHPGDAAALDEAEKLTASLPETPALLAARAALAAERGDAAEAWARLRAAADGRPLRAPRNEDAYVEGRLAEGLGLQDLARDAYQKLPPPGQGSPFSFALLARQRLR